MVYEFNTPISKQANSINILEQVEHDLNITENLLKQV